MDKKDKVICLDFDGVICNSIQECLIVSYNSFYNKDLDNIDNIPESCRNYFFKFRHFVRPAGEYFIVHKAYQDNISLDLNVFNEYKSRYLRDISEFEKKFFKKRRILKENINNWISLHSIYENVKSFLESDSKFYIITTKDYDSVLRLSEYFGFNNQIINVYSKEISTNKYTLFNKLFRENKIDTELFEVIYVDDNQEHLKVLKGIKIKLFLADWGYNDLSGDNINFNKISSLSELK